ncbi:MAG: LacI family DNA-binding transcriptional regulator [Lachnospiraceae bacterium]|nr:LacI family DNA-binding transcriptional regulator [Lachnospiraceae bacterium]
MATIKEIANAVGVSSAAVSRVLNYDETISVSEETRKAIFKTADELGYKKKVVYPKIENVVLLYWVSDEEELEDIYYQTLYKELLAYAKKVNVHISVLTKKDGLSKIPAETIAFIAIGWFNRKELDALHKKCKKGVFINSTPDEKLFDSVTPNFDSFVTQMVDFFVEKKHEKIGFIGMYDRDINTGEPVMDVREWSFRQSMIYYNLIDEDMIYITEHTTVSEGHRLGLELLGKKKRPSALVVASDTLAVGVLQALNEKGVRVPEDIAVFSINDVSVARYVSPPLTSFHIDIPTICESAIGLLREQVNIKRSVTKSVMINGIPQFRKSCE